MTRTLFLKWTFVVLAALAVGGCSTIASTYDKALALVGLKGDKVAWKDVVLVASEGANLNSPVAVDIVLVVEETSMEKVAAQPAAKWFQTRADMLKTFPGSFIYKTWEVSPGQTIRLADPSFGGPRVAGVFVFADYLTPGDHRIRVQELQNGIIVELGARNFSVRPIKAE